MNSKGVRAIPPPPPEADRRPLAGVFDHLTTAVLQQTQAIEKLLPRADSLIRLGTILVIFHLTSLALIAAAVVGLWRR